MDSSRWAVGECIGKGAFGEVYTCVDAKTKQKCVLKKIRMARQTEWQRKATLQEIQLVSNLHNPFIVPYIDSWTHHGHTVNIVYGYCERGDLASEMQRQKGKSFDEEKLKLWLAQLLLAMQHMQDKRVLHRDIKASNIFVTANGDLQLGDFGLATVRSPPKPHSGDIEQTSDQSVGDETPSSPGLSADCGGDDYSTVGTPHYMSPELLSQKNYCYKTDVWSLGCLAYELSAMRPAFNAFNLRGLVSKICKAPSPPLPSGYSNEWSSLIKCMLRKDPTKRPSVADLLSVPFMASAVIAARKKAVEMMPDVVLPTWPPASLYELPPLTPRVTPQASPREEGPGALLATSPCTEAEVGAAVSAFADARVLTSKCHQASDLKAAQEAGAEASKLSIGVADSRESAAPSATAAADGASAACTAAAAASSTPAGTPTATPTAGGCGGGGGGANEKRPSVSHAGLCIAIDHADADRTSNTSDANLGVEPCDENAPAVSGKTATEAAALEPSDGVTTAGAADGGAGAARLITASASTAGGVAGAASASTAAGVAGAASAGAGGGTAAGNKKVTAVAAEKTAAPGGSTKVATAAASATARAQAWLLRKFGSTSSKAHPPAEPNATNKVAQHGPEVRAEGNVDALKTNKAEAVAPQGAASTSTAARLLSNGATNTKGGATSSNTRVSSSSVKPERSSAGSAWSGGPVRTVALGPEASAGGVPERPRRHSALVPSSATPTTASAASAATAAGTFAAAHNGTAAGISPIPEKATARASSFTVRANKTAVAAGTLGRDQLAARPGSFTTRPKAGTGHDTGKADAPDKTAAYAPSFTSRASRPTTASAGKAIGARVPGSNKTPKTSSSGAASVRASTDGSSRTSTDTGAAGPSIRSPRTGAACGPASAATSKTGVVKGTEGTGGRRTRGPSSDGCPSTASVTPRSSLDGRLSGPLAKTPPRKSPVKDVAAAGVPAAVSAATAANTPIRSVALATRTSMRAGTTGEIGGAAGAVSKAGRQSSGGADLALAAKKGVAVLQTKDADHNIIAKPPSSPDSKSETADLQPRTSTSALERQSDGANTAKEAGPKPLANSEAANRTAGRLRPVQPVTRGKLEAGSRITSRTKPPGSVSSTTHSVLSKRKAGGAEPASTTPSACTPAVEGSKADADVGGAGEDMPTATPSDVPPHPVPQAVNAPGCDAPAPSTIAGTQFNVVRTRASTPVSTRTSGAAVQEGGQMVKKSKTEVPAAAAINRRQSSADTTISAARDTAASARSASRLASTQRQVTRRRELAMKSVRKAALPSAAWRLNADRTGSDRKVVGEAAGRRAAWAPPIGKPSSGGAEEEMSEGKIASVPAKSAGSQADDASKRRLARPPRVSDDQALEYYSSPSKSGCTNGTWMLTLPSAAVGNLSGTFPGSLNARFEALGSLRGSKSCSHEDGKSGGKSMATLSDNGALVLAVAAAGSDGVRGSGGAVRLGGRESGGGSRLSTSHIDFVEGLGGQVVQANLSKGSGEGASKRDAAPSFGGFKVAEASESAGDSEPTPLPIHAVVVAAAGTLEPAGAPEPATLPSGGPALTASSQTSGAGGPAAGAEARTDPESACLDEAACPLSSGGADGAAIMPSATNVQPTTDIEYTYDNQLFRGVTRITQDSYFSSDSRECSAGGAGSGMGMGMSRGGVFIRVTSGNESASDASISFGGSSDSLGGSHPQSHRPSLPTVHSVPPPGTAEGAGGGGGAGAAGPPSHKPGAAGGPGHKPHAVDGLLRGADSTTNGGGGVGGALPLDRLMELEASLAAFVEMYNTGQWRRLGQLLACVSGRDVDFKAAKAAEGDAVAHPGGGEASKDGAVQVEQK